MGRSDLAARRAEEAKRLPRMVHHRDERRAAVDAMAVDRESYLRRSRTYSDVGRFDLALLELLEILKVEPDLAEGHLAAAGVYDALGRPADALASVETALVLGGDEGEATPLRASVLFKLGRLEEAEKDARVVLQDSPEDVHMLLLLSMGAAQRGDVTTLVETLDRVQALQTNDPELGRLLVLVLDDVAASYAAIGRYDVAQERIEQVLAIIDRLGESVGEAETYRGRLELYRSRRE